MNPLVRGCRYPRRMIATTIKLFCVGSLYPKLAMLSLMMVTAIGSATPGNASYLVLLGYPAAMLLLISPLFFWVGASRFRRGDAVPGLVLMAGFLVPALAINAYLP